MKHYLNKFLADETGAVTVDWVVITALIVALSLAIMTSLRGATSQSIVEMFTNINAAL